MKYELKKLCVDQEKEIEELKKGYVKAIKWKHHWEIKFLDASKEVEYQQKQNNWIKLQKNELMNEIKELKKDREELINLANE